MQYNYEAIIAQLQNCKPADSIQESAIGDFIYFLENNHRMHWIDDALMEDYSETTKTLASKLNITLTLKHSKR